MQLTTMAAPPPLVVDGERLVCGGCPALAVAYTVCCDPPVVACLEHRGVVGDEHGDVLHQVPGMHVVQWQHLCGVCGSEEWAAMVSTVSDDPARPGQFPEWAVCAEHASRRDLGLEGRPFVLSWRVWIEHDWAVVGGRRDVVAVRASGSKPAVEGWLGGSRQRQQRDPHDPMFRLLGLDLAVWSTLDDGGWQVRVPYTLAGAG